MDLSSIRKEFDIFVVDSEDGTRELLLDTLGSREYRVQTFASAEDALTAIETNPPHVVLSAQHLLGMSGLDFLDGVKRASSDIQFIFMTTYANIDSAMEAVRRGAYDYIYKPFEDINEVAITVDHVIEKIYLQFKNEQLLEELQLKKKTVRKAKGKIRKEREDQQHIATLLNQMALSTDAVQVFVEHASSILGDVPVLFLKHIPSYFTLTVTHSAVVPMTQVRGLGLNLKNEVSPNYLQMLRSPRELPSLKLLMFEAFGARDFEAVALEGDDGVAGIVVALQKIEDAGQKRLFDTFVQLLRVHYANSMLRKSLHTQAIRDSLTGLHNRKSFEASLQEEVSRARRIELPVSLITVGVDHFGEFIENNGQALGDIVLKMIGSLLQRTSRTIDIVGRLGPSEFAVILPHTGKIGAATKAEKLRKLVELTRFPQRETQPGQKFTVSIGVSEYPSLCHDGDALLQTADSAYFQVKETTNKVCLAAPPHAFQPDFETGS